MWKKTTKKVEFCRLFWYNGVINRANAMKERHSIGKETAMTLIFSNDADFGLQAALDLRTEGIFALAYPLEMALSVCERLDFGCAILDGRLGEKSAVALSEELFLRYPELPLAYLADPSDTPAPHAALVIRSHDPTVLKQEISTFCREIPGTLADYSTFALQYRRDSDSFTYLGYPLRLCQSERRLLLCVLHRAPDVAPTEIILSTAFAGTRTTKASLITLAANVNRAAKSISGRALMQGVRNQGFRLCGGILSPNARSHAGRKDLS